MAEHATNENKAAAMGAITQFRALGGVVGFAITSNVFNAYVKANLQQTVSPGEVSGVLDSFSKTLASLSPEAQGTVRDTFAKAYDIEISILIGFAAAQVLAVGLLWERQLRKLV